MKQEKCLKCPGNIICSNPETKEYFCQRCTEEYLLIEIFEEKDFVENKKIQQWLLPKDEERNLMKHLRKKVFL